jgi:hypothetical protein
MATLHIARPGPLRGPWSHAGVAGEDVTSYQLGKRAPAARPSPIPVPDDPGGRIVVRLRLLLEAREELAGNGRQAVRKARRVLERAPATGVAGPEWVERAIGALSSEKVRLRVKDQDRLMREMGNDRARAMAVRAFHRVAAELLRPRREDFVAGRFVLSEAGLTRLARVYGGLRWLGVAIESGYPWCKCSTPGRLSVALATCILPDEGIAAALSVATGSQKADAGGDWSVYATVQNLKRDGWLGGARKGTRRGRKPKPP